MPSYVTQIPAASAVEALSHFSQKLAYETDCWDVHHALSQGATDFVLLDVRDAQAYAAGHVPGATHFPHGKLIASKVAEWPQEMTFVVYCAGPHCNGADKAAVRLAKLGRPVKIMIGGAIGWLDEGFRHALGTEPGSVLELEAV